MSSTSNSTSTAINSSTVGVNMTKFKSGASQYGFILTFSIIALGLFIGAFVSMSNFVGSKDDWNLIRPQITKILILVLVGTVSLMIAAFLYFMQDSAKAIYFILVVSCLSLGLSYGALAVSVISR
jgi:hypothetical protein